MHRIALVTSATRGIGLVIAEELAGGHGLAVLLGSRDLAAGRAAAVNLPGRVNAVELDLTDSTRFTANFAAILASHAPVTGLASLHQLSRPNRIGYDYDSLRQNLSLDYVAPEATLTVPHNYASPFNETSPNVPR